MRTCSLLIASPSTGFLPRIAQRIKLPTSVWNSVAPLSSSRGKARASVIGDTGLPVRGLVIVLQIRSSGIPRAFIWNRGRATASGDPVKWMRFNM